MKGRETVCCWYNTNPRVTVVVVKRMYIGLGCDRVNILHRSMHGAMFWVCDQKSVDNTSVF